MKSPTSAIPIFYYVIFALVEPTATLIRLIVTLRDPSLVHNAQAPWSADSPPPTVLPKASIVTVVQLARVCALLGLVNIVILTGARKHLASQPALQEKIVRALLAPLLIRDIIHLLIMFWALGSDWWKVAQWCPGLRATIVIGFALMIPRITWHLGVWRYVNARDGAVAQIGNSPWGSQSKNAHGSCSFF